MAGSVNRVILIGNLGKDPVIREVSGGKFASFSVATSESWRDKSSGERKEKTEWHNVSVSNEGLVWVVEKYLKKGSTIYVEGKLQTRKWTDKDGVEKYSTEVVVGAFGGVITMLGGKSDGGSSNQDSSSGSSASKPAARDLDDQIPF